MSSLAKNKFVQAGVALAAGVGLYFVYRHLTGSSASGAQQESKEVDDAAVREKLVTDMFFRLDANKDGVVTFEEVVARLRSSARDRYLLGVSNVAIVADEVAGALSDVNSKKKLTQEQLWAFFQALQARKAKAVQAAKDSLEGKQADALDFFQKLAVKGQNGVSREALHTQFAENKELKDEWDARVGSGNIFAIIDSNADETITEEEFLLATRVHAHVRARAFHDSETKAVAMSDEDRDLQAERWFAELDRNGNGAVTFVELIKVLDDDSSDELRALLGISGGYRSPDMLLQSVGSVFHEICGESTPVTRQTFLPFVEKCREKFQQARERHANLLAAQATIGVMVAELEEDDGGYFTGESLRNYLREHPEAAVALETISGGRMQDVGPRLAQQTYVTIADILRLAED